MSILTSILKSVGKVVGKGAVKYGEKSFDDATKLGAGSLKIASDVGERIIDSFTKEGGLGKKVKDHLIEKIPEDEREDLVDEMIPYRMKKYKTKLNMSEPVKDENGKTTKGPRVIIDGKETNLFDTKVIQGSTWLKDNLIKSPGGRIALGITGAGFFIGLGEGGNATKLGDVEGEKLANMVSDEVSPLMHDQEAIDHTELHNQINTYGADGNIVFALHNMR